MTRFDTRVAKDLTKTEWLTPPYILEALRKYGEFDLDPCAPVNRPWDTARKHYTIEDNGLLQEWEGKVWCNPPYGVGMDRWMKRLKEHGNGIALIFARTEIKMWFDHIWYDADALLFIQGRLDFYHVTGEKGKSSSGAPSVLVAYGADNAWCLEKIGEGFSKIKGRFIDLRS